MTQNNQTKKRKVILAVDDTPDNLSLLIKHLKTLDYQVLVAESGPSALEQVQYIRPDLILLDVLMPGLDGFATCQLLKANAETGDIPVIFVTALSETVDKVKGFAVGGVDFVTKPIETSEVTSRVKTHILLHELQKELANKNEQLQEALERRNLALAIETKLRQQSQTDKENLLDFTKSQGAQLQSIFGSILQGENDKNRIWQLLLQPLDAQLFETKSAIAQLNELHHSPDASVLILRLAQLVQNSIDELNRMTADLSKLTHDKNKIDGLSQRELDILIRLANGENNEEIAISLNLASATVRTYRIRIMRKLEIHNLPGLVKFALRHGLIQL